MSIVIGSPELAAVEFVLDEPLDPDWMYGRLRLLLRGQELGDWDDEVTLFAVGNWWRSFVDVPKSRWDPRLEGLDRDALFQLLSDSFYVEDVPGGPLERANRFHINQLGMSAFDPWVVVLVEPPDGRDQQVLWRGDDPGEVVREARLPAGELQRVGAEFLEALEAEKRRLSA
jgi:hypothetical protein